MLPTKDKVSADMPLFCQFRRIFLSSQLLAPIKARSTKMQIKMPLS